MRNWLFPLILALSTLALAQETRYPDDLAWQLVSPYEVRRVTNCKQRLREEQSQAEPLLEVQSAPLGQVSVTPDQEKRLVAAPSQWQLPPFAAVEPALPRDLPESVKQQLREQQEREAGPTPDVWSGLAPEQEKPSIMLKPRAAYSRDRLVPRRLETPRPFSLRRYSDKGKDPFFQIALYGGTTSFRAEGAYLALRAAALDRQKLEGVGKEAFLTRIDIFEELEEPAQEVDPQAFPFEAVEVIGRPRPDLFDSGLANATLAPSWKSIPTNLDSPQEVRLTMGAPKKVQPREPKKLQELMVLVAYFPDFGLTLELATDSRIATVQDLVTLGLGVQSKLLRDWSE